MIFPPESKPFGLSYSDWCIKWCQWISKIPKQSNPTLDKSGGWTIQSQNDSEVIFLCQTFESVQFTPHRHVILPLGSKIFMPIINWISVLGGKEKETMDLKNKAEESMDEVVELIFFINGRQIPINLWDFRVQTPVFEIDLPEMNIFDVPKGNTLMLVDGFWIFFQPIVSNLSVETFGACRSGKTRISVNYDLKIDKDRDKSVKQRQKLIS